MTDGTSVGRFRFLRKGARIRSSGLLLAAALISAPAEAQRPEGRWWVVLGASPAPDMVWRSFPDAERAAAAARRCGIQTLGDFSGRFEGFAPDLYVTVAGPYRTRAEARDVLDRARPCVPDAYLREGSRAGD